MKHIQKPHLRSIPISTTQHYPCPSQCYTAYNDTFNCSFTKKHSMTWHYCSGMHHILQSLQS